MKGEPKRPIRLMLVDDETEFLSVISQALRRRGFEVTTVQKPSLVLDIIRQESFDVAVLDVKMPEISGDDLFREIKKNQPDLPVILLTGHASLNQAFQTSREGVFDYLAKPCDVEVLAKVAKKAVNFRRTKSRNSEPEIPGAEIRLLLVDDEQDLLRSLSSVLERRGIRVSTAGNEAEAYKHLDRLVFDVAVVDIRLPDGDGMELFYRIKKTQPLCEVILLTGQPSVETAVEGVKEGAFDYLVKPQDVENIVRKIRAAFQRHEENSAAARTRSVEKILDRHGN